MAFAGHMVDTPGRAKARFPAANEPLVAAALRELLARLDARVGVSSLANGADVLFGEAMLERGGELHVVLPLNIEEFLEQSVRNSEDDRWEARFHALRALAACAPFVHPGIATGTYGKVVVTAWFSKSSNNNVPAGNAHA